MSVFLYVAIIAIWLFVLVPRWLRRSHGLQAGQDEPAGYVAEAGDDYPADGDEQAEQPGEADGYYPVSGPARPPGPPYARRSRVLQARRRLLTILVLLTAVAGACVALKLTSWWALGPPAFMLGMYVLLLREAAIADAENARRQAVADSRVQAARQRAEEQQLAEEERYSAQIIDISARIGDQLYDQYADAKVRAVGD